MAAAKRLGSRWPILAPNRANASWSLDLLSDMISGGRFFRVLAIDNDYTRECPARVTDTSLLGLRVSRELNGVILLRRRPQGRSRPTTSYVGKQLWALAQVSCRR